MPYCRTGRREILHPMHHFSVYFITKWCFPQDSQWILLLYSSTIKWLWNKPSLHICLDCRIENNMKISNFSSTESPITPYGAHLHPWRVVSFDKHFFLSPRMWIQCLPATLNITSFQFRQYINYTAHLITRWEKYIAFSLIQYKIGDLTQNMRMFMDLYDTPHARWITVHKASWDSLIWNKIFAKYHIFI